MSLPLSTVKLLKIFSNWSLINQSQRNLLLPFCHPFAFAMVTIVYLMIHFQSFSNLSSLAECFIVNSVKRGSPFPKFSSLFSSRWRRQWLVSSESHCSVIWQINAPCFSFPLHHLKLVFFAAGPAGQQRSQTYHQVLAVDPTEWVTAQRP